MASRVPALPARVYGRPTGRPAELPPWRRLGMRVSLTFEYQRFGWRRACPGGKSASAHRATLGPLP